MNWPLFHNSLGVSAGATALALGLGLAAALFAAGVNRRWRSVVVVAAVVALALPPFLVTNAWLNLLGNTGVWRSWLPLDIYSHGGAAWVLALLLWPIPFLFTLAAWERIPTSQIESDEALAGGASLRWIFLPAAAAPLRQATLITWVLALGNFAVPAILQVKVFPAEVWVRFSTSFDFAGAALLSLPLILPPLGLVLWLHARPLCWPRFEGRLEPSLVRRRLGGWWAAAAVGSLGALVLGVGLPVLELASSNRTWAELPGAWAAGGPALRTSIQLAATTATVVVTLGFALGRWSAGQGLWLLWLVPGVFLGMACLMAFNRGVLVGFYQSSGIVILALALRYLAIGWQGAHWSRAMLDPELEESARLDGATPWQRLRWVRWPQIAIPLAATWYVVFLLTLWDVETLLLIVPPGGETLALRIFNLLHYGHNAQVDALCLILLGVALAPLGAWHVARGCGLGRVWRISP